MGSAVWTEGACEETEVLKLLSIPEGGDRRFPRAGQSQHDNALDGANLATIGTGRLLNDVGAEIDIFVKQFA